MSRVLTSGLNRKIWQFLHFLPHAFFATAKVSTLYPRLCWQHCLNRFKKLLDQLPGDGCSYLIHLLMVNLPSNTTVHLVLHNKYYVITLRIKDANSRIKTTEGWSISGERSLTCDILTFEKRFWIWMNDRLCPQNYFVFNVFFFFQFSGQCHILCGLKYNLRT